MWYHNTYNIYCAKSLLSNAPMSQKKNVKVLAKCQWKFRFSLQSNCWRNVLFPKLQNLNCINPLQMAKLFWVCVFELSFQNVYVIQEASHWGVEFFSNDTLTHFVFSLLKDCWNPHYIIQTARSLVLRLNSLILIKRDKLEFHWEIWQQIAWKGWYNFHIHIIFIIYTNQYLVLRICIVN